MSAGATCGTGKPNPEVFQIVVRELQMKPGHCLVAEDAPTGVQAVRVNGMAAFGVASLDYILTVVPMHGRLGVLA